MRRDEAWYANLRAGRFCRPALFLAPGSAHIMRKGEIIMKRILAALLCLVALFTLCACSGGGSPAETQAVRVGIIQFADHPSLDNCREGFLEGMEKAPTRGFLG